MIVLMFKHWKITLGVLYAAWWVLTGGSLFSLAALVALCVGGWYLIEPLGNQLERWVKRDMHIFFKCSKCGTNLMAPRGSFGSELKCAECDDMIAIPGEPVFNFFPCPHCKMPLQSPKEAPPGTKSLCPGCQGEVAAPGTPDPNWLYYVCPHCKASLGSAKEQAGKMTPCSACGKEIAVPGEQKAATGSRRTYKPRRRTASTRRSG